MILACGTPVALTATLADTNWTDTTLDGAPLVDVIALDVLNEDTSQDLSIRFGTTGTEIPIPATTDGNGSYSVPIPAGRGFQITATNKLQVKSSGGSSHAYTIVYVPA